jgi:hypothetical protein
MYNYENWILNRMDRQEIEVIEKKSLRSLAGYKLNDHECNSQTEFNTFHLDNKIEHWNQDWY